MNLIIMDESEKRTGPLKELLKKKNCDVAVCSRTGDFLEQIDEATPDMLLLDIDTWQRGRSIFKYFDFTKKLDETPILFYNAPDNFVTINGRQRNDNDRVLNKPYDVEAVTEALDQI